jgi:tetratricopeptide (TPR) repeat protein
MRIVVALAAVSAAALVAGVVLATRQDPPQPKTLCESPRAVVYPGVPTGNAATVRAAFGKGVVEAARVLEPLTQEHPGDPVVQFNYATALYCAGFPVEAEDAYRKAKKAGRNTWYQVEADVLLHPQYFQKGPFGYPTFTYFGKEPLLVQGQIQQRAFHPASAEALYARAARLHPRDADAQVAAAVGRFDMDDLAASFSRLGPLVKRFPHSQTVRFHLGLLLTWTGQAKLAVTEFRAARALGPATVLGRDANAFLKRLVTGGTNGP